MCSGRVNTMSQDMTPPAGERPTGTPDTTGTGQSATPRYSAPSPTDTPTGASATASSGAGPRPSGYPQGPRPQAWSQTPGHPNTPADASTHPGSAAGDQSWWQPRPSGAWSSQNWGGPTGAPTGGHGPASAPTSTYTQTLPRTPGQDAYSSYPRSGYTGPTTSVAPGTATDDAAKPRGRKTSLIVATTTALALIAGFAGGYAGSAWESSNSAASDSSLSRLNTSAPVSQNLTAPAGSVQEVAAKVLPSVVSVLATSSQGGGEGSGIILTADGLILTNNHVVQGATDLEVRFNDGSTAAAKVVGKTATDDLAVIKADGVSGLTPAALGNSSDLQVGQQVVAIGSPLGLSATVTSGIVSALNRPVRTAAEGQSTQSQDTVINAVQTDAAINPGNSGGALVDMSGSVIGINSAIASLSDSSSGQSGSIGVGFAIPIDQAKRIAQEIIDTGQATHAVLGAAVGDATDGNSQITTGAKIDSVTPGSGADAAGLQKGDVVTAIGDVKIESADALIAAVRAQAPNGTTTITIDRNGNSQTVNVTLGSANAN